MGWGPFDDIADWWGDRGREVGGWWADNAGDMARGAFDVVNPLNVVTGQSPLSPAYPAVQLSEHAGDAIRDSDPAWCGPAKPLCAGVKAGAEVSKMWDRIEGAISSVPYGAGWWAIGLLLLWWFLSRLLPAGWRGSVTVGKKAATVAAPVVVPVVKEAGGAYLADKHPRAASAIGIEPMRRGSSSPTAVAAKVRRSVDAVKLPLSFGRHAAVAGRVEFVDETLQGALLCADSVDHALEQYPARRNGREVVRHGQVVECDIDPVRVHVPVRTRALAKKR